MGFRSQFVRVGVCIHFDTGHIPNAEMTERNSKIINSVRFIYGWANYSSHVKK